MKPQDTKLTQKTSPFDKDQLGKKQQTPFGGGTGGTGGSTGGTTGGGTTGQKPYKTDDKSTHK